MELEEALKLIETQKADIEKTKNDISAIKAKNEELLGETKKAKLKAKEEADLAAQALADKALKDGDFEQLLKSSEEERDKATKELAEMKASAEKETHVSKVNSFGLSFEPLSDHSLGDLTLRLKSRTKVVDGELKVLDKNGELTVSSLDDLKGEMVASGEISHLIKGNQSSGGGASGGDKDPNNQKLSSTQKIAAGLKKL